MDSEAAAPLAKQALDLARTELLVNLRFMNAAFARLSYFPVPGATLATDGSHLRYDPVTIARSYAEESTSVARIYLHMVLHNVFLHTFPGLSISKPHWNTACDIVVERAITDLDLPATRTSYASHQKAIFAQLDASLSLITAETVYRWLLDQHLSADELASLREPFLVDDHETWYRLVTNEQKNKTITEGDERAEKQDDGSAAKASGAAKDGTSVDLPEDAASAKRSHASHRAMADEDITQKETPENARRTIGERFADTVNLDRSKQQWQEAAYEMGIQLDSYTKLWGIEGANLAMNLKSVTRERQDYREFLRKFARMGEQIRVNDDEFDYVYYCFGLRRYGNLPLIEPLEYVEEKRIRDFVIAIDTSASTKDGLVRKFIEKTYAILSNETSFFAQMNVLIIQCDAAIVDVAPIKTLSDLENYLDAFQVKGLGGTDFRPVFTYVDQALELGDLANLGGLIYFTDGQGTYPAKKPDYDTAFVFVDEASAATSQPVPTWAMSVILDETLILDEN